MSVARPLVAVYESVDGKLQQNAMVPMPAVMQAPIRPDLVAFVSTSLQKNKRQPYAVKDGAGYQSSAESWGTGRAVSRIPRVPGGGTHRAGQAAFGNFCRGGGMFAPTKVWRRWHRHVNLKQKRHALCSAIAATAYTGLVMGRGHRIGDVPQIPMVVSDNLEKVTKTKDAVAMLTTFGKRRPSKPTWKVLSSGPTIFALSACISYDEKLKRPSRIDFTVMKNFLCHSYSDSVRIDGLACVEAKRSSVFVIVTGCAAELEKSKESKKIRAGKGKARNRRTVSRKGPLIVYHEDHGIVGATANVPGVKAVHVDRLNLLDFAPGGNLGRFVIWTRSAFERLQELYGDYNLMSSVKSNFILHRPMMSNADLHRVINCSELQQSLTPALRGRYKAARNRNLLRNLSARLKIDPYYMARLTKRRNMLKEDCGNKPKTELTAA